MKGHSETRTLDSGARVEVGNIEHEGRSFSALGSVIDHARGVIVAYVSERARPTPGADRRYELTTWEGTTIAPLRLVRRWTSYGCVRAEMWAWSATIDGRVYSGRNGGPAVVLCLRAKGGR